MGTVGNWRALLLGALLTMLLTSALLAPSAGAVVVHLGNGQVAGVTPVTGVSAASFPRSVARRGAAGAIDNGTLSYGQGVVLHASAPFLIFWDPNHEFTPTEKALYERFFADSAADSGTSANVYSVNRQYTDTTGFADYSQAWGASQSITDTQPYPAGGQCTPAVNYGESTCLFDSQLQAEVSRVIAAGGLPTGVTGNAPIYFVVTPPSVDSCFTDGSSCTDNGSNPGFCAYHSSYLDGSSTVLYADIPTVLAYYAPKSCQADAASSVVQSPNSTGAANLSATDVAIKYTSHEFNEVITDPVNGSGWYDHVSGQENGDECNFYNGTTDPAGGYSLNAYAPTLGGVASAGTLYDQLMNGNPYYTQSEWSNGDINCEMRPTPSTLSAGFVAPASAVPGAAVSLDPSVSSSAGGYTSTTWSFGDATSSFSSGALAGVSHVYPATGTYTVTLTLVDGYGNLSRISHVITVHGPETAAVRVGTVQPTAGVPVSFDGSGSSDPGAGISSYSWSFGDGSPGGGGAVLLHAYPHPGTYSVVLTITDNLGATSTATRSITVTPQASIGRVSVKQGRKIELIKLRVTGPGTLGIGHTRLRVGRAQTLTVRIRLSRSALRILHHRHKLTLRVRLTFQPTIGQTSHKTVTIRLKP